MVKAPNQQTRNDEVMKIFKSFFFSLEEEY